MNYYANNYGGNRMAAVVASKSKKRKAAEPVCDEEEDSPAALPFQFPKLGGTSVYAHANHVYFNDEISDESVFDLNKELRVLASKQKMLALTNGTEPAPIYLHISTYGGSIHAAFSAVDCIQNLGVPVCTVVDGFVASAGTLISLAGEKRYIQPNAYMLIHELRSGVWGKMTSIEEEVDNLKKIMKHINEYYENNSKLSKRDLEKILTKDVIWNAEECVKHGVADEIKRSF